MSGGSRRRSSASSLRISLPGTVTHSGSSGRVRRRARPRAGCMMQEDDHEIVVIPTTTTASWRRIDGVELLADPGDVEDALGDDRTAHQRTELDPEERHHGDQRVAQAVLAQDRPSGRPLARAVRMKSAPKVSSRLCARQPQHVGQGQRRQHEGRHEVAPSASPPRYPAGATSPSFTPKNHCTMNAEHEHRDGDEHQGAGQGELVEQPALAPGGDDADRDAQRRSRSRTP